MVAVSPAGPAGGTGPSPRRRPRARFRSLPGPGAGLLAIIRARSWRARRGSARRPRRRAAIRPRWAGSNRSASAAGEPSGRTRGRAVSRGRNTASPMSCVTASRKAAASSSAAPAANGKSATGWGPAKGRSSSTQPSGLAHRSQPSEWLVSATPRSSRDRPSAAPTSSFAARSRCTSPGRARPPRRTPEPGVHRRLRQRTRNATGTLPPARAPGRPRTRPRSLPAHRPGGRRCLRPGRSECGRPLGRGHPGKLGHGGTGAAKGHVDGVHRQVAKISQRALPDQPAGPQDARTVAEHLHLAEDVQRTRTRSAPGL